MRTSVKDLIQTGAAAGTGIASSSYSTIKAFLAESVVNKPGGYDIFVARLIAALSVAYLVLKIYKLWKAKAPVQIPTEEEER